jgi:hypothetical protein
VEEVHSGVITDVVGGPHVETVSSGHGIGFWFNTVDQLNYPVNRMATLLLLATLGLAPREVLLLYGPVLVASHDGTGQPAGLSREQIKLLGGGPKFTRLAEWTLQRRAGRDARRRRRLRGR